MMPKNNYPYFPPTNQVIINQKVEPVIARPCHPGQPVRPCPISPMKHKIPTSGPLTGNGFRLVSGVPYLIDTTQMLFGAKINVGDNVYTRITKRADLGCIDLSARIDMTTSTHTDTALVKYLNDTIAQSYHELQEYLPMMQSPLVCTLHYNILDQDRGIVTSGELSGTTENIKFHETNINDYYLTSAYSTLIGDILPMGYAGPYFLELTSFDVAIPSFNTKEHLDAGMNPFYAFSDDYSSIMINHEAAKEIIDKVAILPIVQVQFTEGNLFEFEANIATRFKFTFEAYMSDMIWETNTYETYQALYNPAQERITALEEKVAELTTELENTQTLLSDTITRYDAKFQEVDDALAALDTRVTALEQSDAAQNETLASHTTSLSDLDTRVTALESIKAAVVWYRADKQIYASQLIWQTYGDLYQATKDFIASGDFNADVEAGNLIRLRDENSTTSDVIEPTNGTETSDGDVVNNTIPDDNEESTNDTP